MSIETRDLTGELVRQVRAEQEDRAYALAASTSLESPKPEAEIVDPAPVAAAQGLHQAMQNQFSSYYRRHVRWPHAGRALGAVFGRRVVDFELIRGSEFGHIKPLRSGEIGDYTWRSPLLCEEEVELVDELRVAHGWLFATHLQGSAIEPKRHRHDYSHFADYLANFLGPLTIDEARESQAGHMVSERKFMVSLAAPFIFVDPVYSQKIAELKDEAIKEGLVKKDPFDSFYTDRRFQFFLRDLKAYRPKPGLAKYGKRYRELELARTPDQKSHVQSFTNGKADDYYAMVGKKAPEIATDLMNRAAREISGK